MRGDAKVIRPLVRGVLAALVPVAFLAGTPPIDEAVQPVRTTLVRRFTPAHQIAGRYQYVPFEVPANTGTLRVRYDYDRANGDNVIDLGLFEPGSLELGTPAFRGYSGGAKSEVTIGRDMTTPGYRPGPIPAGQWHVLLGLYRVSEAGIGVTITIETETGSAFAPSQVGLSRRSGRQAAKADEVNAPKWYMGALHTHTLHSDGTVTPLALMRMMRDAKFDFVAITDHNNTTHQYELAPQYSDRSMPLWIVGEEVTTPGGHASVWGLDGDEWVDFRVSPQDGRIGELVAAARRYGAVFSINHPASECVACGWTHEVVDGIEAVEISNGRHGEIEKALALWDGWLQGGRRLTGVGSSDWHTAPNAIDNANVRVYASSLSEEAILGAIRSGHVIIMTRARDATPDIVFRSGASTARVGDSLVVAPGALVSIEINAPSLPGARLVVVANGVRQVPETLDGAGQIRLARRAQPGYIRLELRGPDDVPLAITNPVYMVQP